MRNVSLLQVVDAMGVKRIIPSDELDVFQAGQRSVSTQTKNKDSENAIAGLEETRRCFLYCQYCRD